MSAEEKSRSRLLRWLQNLAVITVMALLVMKLLEIGIFHDRWGWQSAEREVVQRRFNENAMLARTEWLRQGKPQQVALQTQQQVFQVQMNRHGWPSVDNGCLPLWQMLAGGRLEPRVELQSQQCWFWVDVADSEVALKVVYDARTGQLK